MAGRGGWLAWRNAALSDRPGTVPAVPPYLQQSLDQIIDDPGEATLRDTTFVVLDLETTGGSPDDCGITEIGAVKVRGGEQLGEFATLVNPGIPIPPYITVLTGITEAMVLPAPRLDEVLPAFLEFSRGAVLVAHNAPYDIGFLKAACARHGHPWPKPVVLDTVVLARRALTRDEVPNHKLGTLARFFRTATEPCHRALADARATVDVLHGLIERLGSYRVFTLSDAIAFSRAVSPVQRRKRHLAEGLPDAPGVYVFRGGRDRVLYVGTSRSIVSRVRSYFTASEKRARMTEMLAAAERVEPIVCAHALEAEIRELRLIAAHKPPYNRRSKFPERAMWLKLTAEPYPRLSVVRRVLDDGASYLGPFGSRRAAELAAAGVYDAVPLRQCTHRLSIRTATPACALAELGRCAAPCEHRVSSEEYERIAADPVRRATVDAPDPLIERLLARIGELSEAWRYEDAAVVRGRLAMLLRAVIRMQRLRSLTTLEQVVAARPAEQGGWELAVIRHGRLAAAGTSPPRIHPQPTIDVLLATAETVLPGPGPTPAATAEETERILAWLERQETRLVQVSDGWSLPAAGAGRWLGLLSKVDTAGQPNGYPQVTDRWPPRRLG